MKKYEYDMIVIGGGSAGLTAAMLAKGLGKKIAILDRKKIGGECTWTGCIPSKSLLHAAKIARRVKKAAEYGIMFSSVPRVRYHDVLERVRGVVEKVYRQESPVLLREKGIYALEGVNPVFMNPHTLDLDGKTMTSKTFLIATGSSPFVPPVEGLREGMYHTNETIFSLKKIPRSLIIMGGGSIGVELATAFNGLGSSVTVLEMARGILPREDEELAAMLSRSMSERGIAILTESRVVRFESGKGSLSAVYEHRGAQKKLSADVLLIAVGRKPNCEGLGLDRIGVQCGKTGIAVNSLMRTTVPNIYAAGDVAGPYQFSHMASYQAIVAATNALLPLRRRVRYDHVPWCTFTDPELARSGLTEHEAREKYGNRIRIYRADYDTIDRSKTDLSGPGMAKCICDRKGRILGIHILGERSAEVMHEVHAAKAFTIPLHGLQSVIHAYPTYAEIVGVLARNAYIDKIQRNIFIRAIKKIRNLL